MTRKYQVTDSRGKVHKRTTKSRVYQFCVVHHIREREYPLQPGKIWPAYSNAEWAGTRQLAENVARRWQRHPNCEATEIIEAKEATHAN